MAARRLMNPAADDQVNPDVRRIIAYVTRYDHVPVLLANVDQLANVIRRLGYDLPPVGAFVTGGRPWLHAILDRTLPPLVRDVVIELVAAYTHRTPAWTHLPRTQEDRRGRATALRTAALDVLRFQRVWQESTQTYWMGVPRDMPWPEPVGWFWRFVRRTIAGKQPATAAIAPPSVEPEPVPKPRRRPAVKRRGRRAARRRA
jgi:hypothetical protein